MPSSSRKKRHLSKTKSAEKVSPELKKTQPLTELFAKMDKKTTEEKENISETLQTILKKIEPIGRIEKTLDQIKNNLETLEN